MQTELVERGTDFSETFRMKWRFRFDTIKMHPHLSLELLDGDLLYDKTRFNSVETFAMRIERLQGQIVEMLNVA